MSSSGVKLAAGGTALAGIVAASAVGVSKALQPIDPSLTIGFQLTNYEIKKEDNNCKAHLEKEFKGIDEDFKSAFQHCVGQKKLSEFATSVWGLTLLDQSKSDSGDTANKDKDTLEERAKIHRDLLNDSAVDTWKELLNYCISKGELTNSSAEFDDLVWNKYLKVCFKNEGKYSESLDKSFWTKRPINIKTKLELSKFSVIANDENWKYVANALLKGPEGTAVVDEKQKSEKSLELKNSCNLLLLKEYSESTKEDYKKAAQECTELKSFSLRTDKLSIKLHITTGDDWTTDWNTHKDTFKPFLPSSKTKRTISGDGSGDDIKNYCVAAKELNFAKFTTNSELENEWKHFLKFCKVSGTISEDYWTGDKLPE